MPDCQNCGSFVTREYVRVFAPEDVEDGVRVCPECPDKIRDPDGTVRDARVNRQKVSNPGN